MNPTPSAVRRVALVAAVLLAALGPCACARRPDDPVLLLLRSTLKRGDRVVLARALDPQTSRVAAVVDTTAGKPELRFYEQKVPGQYALVHTVQEGDSFKNLSVEDVDGDGKDEIVTTWEGGHQVEKRYDPAGLVEFWITSRTYDEAPGQPAAYGTTIYRLSGGKYVEAARK